MKQREWTCCRREFDVGWKIMLSCDCYKRARPLLPQQWLTQGHDAAMVGLKPSMILTEKCLPQHAVSNPFASRSCSLLPDALCPHSYLPLPLSLALVPPLSAPGPSASALMPLPSALMQLALTLPDVFQLAALPLLSQSQTCSSPSSATPELPQF